MIATSKYGFALLAMLMMQFAFPVLGRAQETEGPATIQADAGSAKPAQNVVPIAKLASGRSCLPAMSNVQARQKQTLDGNWEYLLDGLGEVNHNPEKTRIAVFEDVSDADIGPAVIKEYDWGKAPLIKVPGAWNSQDEKLTWYDQWMWLRRSFDASKGKEQRQFLYFEAANYETVVYLNGKLLGTHRGGFTPFCFEVSDNLKTGRNTLTVGVNAEQDEKTVPPKRSDWTNYGGITRSVHLVHVPETFVSGYKLNLAIDGKSVGFSARLDGASTGKNVRLKIPELGLDRTFLSDNQQKIEAALPLPSKLVRWSPENPKLYDVIVESEGEVIADRIGFRTIKVSDKGDILLNGSPIFLRGISMHEETLGAVPDRNMTDAAARALLSEVKHGLNGNFVRLAHYPHAEAMVRAADEMGVLVWSEVPVYWDVAFDDPEVLALARSMQAENIYRDANRASVVIWSIANETLSSPARHRFLSQLVKDVRALDSTRLISMASHTLRPKDGAIQFNDPVVDEIDIVSVNFYQGWYSEKPLSELPDVQWANNSGKPMIFSEFGADALAGFHSDDRRKFSEEFQADYYRAMISMVKKIPSLRGVSPWILKDFRSPRRFHPVYQEGWNRKGLLAPDGRRKIAFPILAEWYAEIAAKEQK